MPECIVPGAGALTLAPHDAAARQAWQQHGGVPETPQELNRSAYARNNPLRWTDPTGHWIERARDIAFIAYDLYDISQNGLTWENGLALAADVGGLLLPGLTGGGALVRAVAHADDVADAARYSDEAAEVTEQAIQFHGTIYHSASGTADSLTPRPGIDDGLGGGLSFFDSFDNPGIKPGKYVEVDVSKLHNLRAIRDNHPPGHVTVAPASFEELRAWAATRGTGRIHPLTAEVLNAVTRIGKKS